MKKIYIAPSIEVLNVVANNIVATSLGVGEGSTDTSNPDNQDAREDKPSRPNLWEQGW